MAYWGKNPPIIRYGTSYQTAWDLTGVDCTYKYSWVKDRELYQSVLTGTIVPYDKASTVGLGRMTAEITLFNLDVTQMEHLRNLRAFSTVRLTIHADATNSWNVDFVVQQYQPFASGESGLPYPEFDSGYLKLVSQDYIDLNSLQNTEA
jgi:hypothetical protein